jgi:hypothetical protein
MTSEKGKSGNRRVKGTGGPEEGKSESIAAAGVLVVFCERQRAIVRTDLAARVVL